MITTMIKNMGSYMIKLSTTQNLNMVDFWDRHKYAGEYASTPASPRDLQRIIMVS